MTTVFGFVLFLVLLCFVLVNVTVLFVKTQFSIILILPHRTCPSFPRCLQPEVLPVCSHHSSWPRSAYLQCFHPQYSPRTMLPLMLYSCELSGVGHALDSCNGLGCSALYGYCFFVCLF